MPLVGITALLFSGSSYAWHHHGHYHHYHHYHSNDLAAGLIFGAAIGMIAGASMGHDSYDRYDYGSCRRVIYTRRCHYDGWGDYDCYRVKHVEYVC